MSTSYYGMKDPITSIRPEEMGGHTHIGVWVNHAKAGTLVFRNEEWIAGKWIFVGEVCVLRTHHGPENVGLVIDQQIPHLDDERQLMSEYGELTTVGEIRRRTK